MKAHLFMAATLLSAQLPAQNLILNGSNDEDLVGGEIPGWTEVAGTGWTQRCADPEAFAGPCYFFAGAIATAKLEQTIDLTPYADAIDQSLQQFHFTGRARAWGQNPPDAANIILRFLTNEADTLNEVVLGPYTTTTEWVAVDTQLVAPVGSRVFKIALRSDRYNGSNNDGYYDDLALEARSTVGLSESATERLRIAPNPASHRISVDFAPKNADALIVSNTLGQLILTLPINGNQRQTIDISPFENGVYFVKVRYADGTRAVERIVKQ